MNYKLYILVSIILLGLTPDLYADRYLSPLEKGQIISAKKLLGNAHAKSLEDTIAELEESPFTSGQIIIFKAIAKTYDSILDEYPDITEKKKRWVYDQIIMRVAYIQFGGGPKSGSDTKLGKVIQKTLLEHLPEKLLQDPRFNQSLE